MQPCWFVVFPNSTPSCILASMRGEDCLPVLNHAAIAKTTVTMPTSVMITKATIILLVILRIPSVSGVVSWNRRQALSCHLSRPRRSPQLHREVNSATDFFKFLAVALKFRMLNQRVAHFAKDAPGVFIRRFGQPVMHPFSFATRRHDLARRKYARCREIFGWLIFMISTRKQTQTSESPSKAIKRKRMRSANALKRFSML